MEITDVINLSDHETQRRMFAFIVVACGYLQFIGDSFVRDCELIYELCEYAHGYSVEGYLSLMLNLCSDICAYIGGCLDISEPIEYYFESAISSGVCLSDGWELPNILGINND